MSESSVTERGRELLVEDWDILLVTGFIIFMIYQSMKLNTIPRQFPLVFLIMGLVAMLLEMIIRLLPPKYGDPIRRLTTGIAAEMDSELTEDEEEEEEEGEEVQEKRTLAIAIGLIVGFGVLSYLISFLLALPVFVACSIFLLGEGDVKNTILTTIVLLLLVYFVFGDFMNVPIETGEWISADDYLPLFAGGRY